MKLFLTLDVGTTAVKAGLFQEDLAPLCMAIEEYTLLTPENDIVELDPNVYWENVCKGIRAVLAQSGKNPADIVSITCTTQGETLIPVDQKGNALYNAIVWLDARAKKESGFIEGGFSKDVFYKKTGLPEISPYCPVAKLLWLKNNLPEVYERTHKILLLEDYLIAKFTGAFVTNPALACSTGYYDILKDEMWTDILAYCGIDQAKLPAVLPCATIVGRILPPVAQSLSLSTHTVVTTGAMDQVAAAVGCGNIKEDVISDMVGTCQVIGATGDASLLNAWAPVTLYSHVQKGKYLLIIVNQTAGIILKWFRNEFCKDLMEDGEAAAFEKMSALAAAEPPLSRGVALYPRLTGVQVPVNDADARGAFFGIGLDTTRASFIRAVMESVCYMSKESMEIMRLSPKSLISLGGGSKSPVWNQIKADVCNLEIRTMVTEEAALLGAAILGGVATGVLPSLAEACGMVRTKDTFRPAPENIRLYKKGYEKYLEMYDAIKPLEERG